MRKPNNYQHFELDLDGRYYRFMDSDVQMFHHSISASIDGVLNTYRAVIVQDCYISGNYLFFTYKGVKYWDIISNSINETIYIDDIKKDLIALGCVDIAYDEGHLD